MSLQIKEEINGNDHDNVPNKSIIASNTMNETITKEVGESVVESEATTAVQEHRLELLQGLNDAVKSSQEWVHQTMTALGWTKEHLLQKVHVHLL